MKKSLFALLLFMSVIIGYWKMINAPAPSENDKHPTVKIGAIYPMSGDGANFGAAAKATAKIFMENLQKENPRYNYELIWEDNQLKLPQTVNAAQKLISLDNVDVIISCLSNHGQAVSPIAEKNQVLHLSIATDPAVAKGKYNFTIATSPEREAQKLVDELLKRNVKEIAGVVMNAQGPDMIFEIFKKRAVSKGIKVGQVFKNNAGERDFRIVISKINENKPDIIVAMLQMPEIDIFLRQLQQSGSKIPVTGIETFSYLKNKNLAEGMFYVDAAKPSDEFAEKFKAETGADNTEYGEYFYTVLQILTNAYENAEPGIGKPEHLAIAEKILSGSNGMMTAVGSITINNEGVVDSNAVVKRIEDGKTIFIK